MLLLWWLVTTGAVYLIYMLDEPTYEAFSLLHVEPVPVNLFSIAAQNPTDSQSVEPYLHTQVQLILSDKVLTQPSRRPPDRQLLDDQGVEGPEGRPSQGDGGRDCG